MPKPQQQSLQLVFNTLQDKHNELKDLKKTFKGMLEDNQEYVNAAEQVKISRKVMARVKLQTEEAFSDMANKIDSLTTEVKLQKEMVTDVALNQLMAGETVAVEDQDGDAREPVWKVTFKKANVIEPAAK